MAKRKKREPAVESVPAKVTTVSVSMQRVYSLGAYKTLRYEVQAQGEVRPGHDESAAIDQLTAFLDTKVAQFAADRDLDHLVPNRDPYRDAGGEFEDEDDDADPDYEDEDEE